MGNDLELFEQWQAGDRSAGNTLLHRHFQSLYRFFGNKVADEVDELIQNTFLACISAHERIRIKSNFRAYLFAVARHELCRHLQRRQRSEDLLDFGVTSVRDMGISPASQLARNQKYHVLLEGLRSLPVDQQVLLELYYWEDLSVSELSEIFDIEETATRARLTRARQSLRKRMHEMAGETAPTHEQLDDLDNWARSMRAESPSKAGLRR